MNLMYHRFNRVIGVIAGLLAMMVAACSSREGVILPDWVIAADRTEVKDSLSLSQRMVGHWVINEELSDDPHDVIVQAFKNSDVFKRRRGPDNRDESGRPSTGHAQINPMRGIPAGDISDPRLQVLFARQVDISLAGEMMIYRFPKAPPDRFGPEKPGSPKGRRPMHNESESMPEQPTAYPINGKPVSSDGNINIAFAEWEQQRFVIEKNGPRGRIVEYWTPSPDGRQLHLSIRIKPAMLPDTITINRLFESG